MNIDITKIWPGWVITERLGHGRFGHVYKATYAETDAVAAVKVITIPDNPDIIEDLRYSGRTDDEILAMCHEEAEHTANITAPYCLQTKTTVWLPPVCPC